MEQTPLPMGSLDVATLCDLKICLDHPKPAGLGGRERVQTRAFSLIQTQSLSKLARVTAKICGRRVSGGVQDPCYGPSVPSGSQSDLWAGPASPVLSSPGASVRNFGCFIFKAKHLSLLYRKALLLFQNT